MKRIGDDAAVGERQRRKQPPVKLSDQNGLRQRHRAVERSQPRERLLIRSRSESKRHTTLRVRDWLGRPATLQRGPAPLSVQIRGLLSRESREQV
jgi:hypothetical protein